MECKAPSLKEFSSITEFTDYIIKQKPDGGIIALSGHIGTGKNYVGFGIGNELVNLGFNVTYHTFASPLKRLVAEVFGLLKNGQKLPGDYPKGYKYFELAVEEVYYGDEEFEPDILREVYDKLITIYNNSELTDKQKARYLLQEIGNGLRVYLDEDIWCRHMFNRLSGIVHSNFEHGTGIHYAIITDLRYPNEKQYLKRVDEYLLTVRVVAPENVVLERLGIEKEQYRKMLEHDSETSIEFIIPDVIFINA